MTNIVYDSWHISDQTEVVVVFQGGNGGNFIASLISEEQDTAEYNLETNEWIHSCRYNVLETHINMWFKLKDDYNTEVYARDRYRHILNMFTDKKVVVINNRTCPEVTIRALSIIKSDLPDNEKTKILEHWSGEDNMHKRVKHYDFFYNIVQKYAKSVYDLDYYDFFINGNCKSLFDFMEIEDRTDKVIEYTNKNRRLLNKYGLDF